MWQDLDGDGVQDPNEPGLPGVTVLLQTCNGTMLRSTTTDANGQYALSGLPAGSYRVVFVAPSGSPYTISPASQGGDVTKDSDMDASGTTACISLGPYESRTDIDAGFIPGVRGSRLVLFVLLPQCMGAMGVILGMCGLGWLVRVGLDNWPVA